MIIEKHFHPDDSILPDVVELLYMLLADEPVAEPAAADIPTCGQRTVAQAVEFPN